jgi:hypothetical protein
MLQVSFGFLPEQQQQQQQRLIDDQESNQFLRTSLTYFEGIVLSQ